MKRLLASLLLGIFVGGVATWKILGDRPTPTAPIIVEAGPELREEIIKEAKKADVPRSIREGLTTREVKPDTVHVSRFEPELLDTSERGRPGRLLSELPEWGIQEVLLTGHRLEVSSLSRGSGEARREIHTLQAEHPTLILRSGNVPLSVREGRDFRGPLRFGIRATGFGGVDNNTGAATVGGIFEGPVGAQLGLGKIAPAVVVGFGEGIKLGGTYTIRWGDL